MENKPYVDPMEDETLYDDMMAVASQTECTGLMPTPPESRGAAEAYSEIAPVPVAGAGKTPPQNGKRFRYKNNSLF